MTAALVIRDVDWQGFLVVMGVLAFVVLYARVMDHGTYRPTVQQLVHQGLADTAPVSLHSGHVDCTRAGCGRPTGDTLTLEPEVLVDPDPESLDATRPDDIDVCHACGGEGAVMVITGDPYDDAWDSVECCFCQGTGVTGGAA